MTKIWISAASSVVACVPAFCYSLFLLLVMSIVIDIGCCDYFTLCLYVCFMLFVRFYHFCDVFSRFWLLFHVLPVACFAWFFSSFVSFIYSKGQLIIFPPALNRSITLEDELKMATLLHVKIARLKASSSAVSVFALGILYSNIDQFVCVCAHSLSPGKWPTGMRRNRIKEIKLNKSIKKGIQIRNNNMPTMCAFLCDTNSKY